MQRLEERLGQREAQVAASVLAVPLSLLLASARCSDCSLDRRTMRQDGFRRASSRSPQHPEANLPPSSSRTWRVPGYYEAVACIPRRKPLPQYSTPELEQAPLVVAQASSVQELVRGVPGLEVLVRPPGARQALAVPVWEESEQTEEQEQQEWAAEERP